MDHELRMFWVALKLGSGSAVNGAKLRTVWDVFRPTLELEDSGFHLFNRARPRYRFS